MLLGEKTEATCHPFSLSNVFAINTASVPERRPIRLDAGPNVPAPTPHAVAADSPNSPAPTYNGVHPSADSRRATPSQGAEAGRSAPQPVEAGQHGQRLEHVRYPPQAPMQRVPPLKAFSWFFLSCSLSTSAENRHSRHLQVALSFQDRNHIIRRPHL